MMIGTNCGSIWTRTMSEARRNYVKKISEEKFPEQYPGDKEVNGYINRSADFSRWVVCRGSEGKSVWQRIISNIFFPMCLEGTNTTWSWRRNQSGSRTISGISWGKAKSKFMSDIAGGCPPTYGLGPITAVNVGAELVSHCLIGRVFHFYLLISWIAYRRLLAASAENN
jgi:hypothetical protein